MSEFLKVALVVFMAIPFLYMAYDVARDLISQMFTLFAKKAKPALIQITSSLFN